MNSLGEKDNHLDKPTAYSLLSEISASDYQKQLLPSCEEAG